MNARLSFGGLVLSRNGGGTWEQVANHIKYPNYDWAQSVDIKSDPKAIFAIQHQEDKAEVCINWLQNECLSALY